MDLLNKKKRKRMKERAHIRKDRGKKINSHIHLRELSANWDCYIMELECEWIWKKTTEKLL